MIPHALTKRTRVALIDGNVGRRMEEERLLSPFYDVVMFASAQQAIEEMTWAPPSVVVVDELAPPMGAPAFLRALRRSPKLQPIPAICLASHGGAAEIAAREAGADAFYVRPLKSSVIIGEVAGLASRAVEAQWEELPELHRDALRRTVDSFNEISDLIDQGKPLDLVKVGKACAPLVDAVSNHDFHAILDGVRGHDNYSYVHSLRVATFLSLFGYTIGLRGDDLLMLATGGLMHDIGKVSIPYEVLNKPGRLEPAEWEVMKSHVARSVAYLREHSQAPHAVLTVAAQHHEKLNGSGYPNGLSGGQLNELARMASIVDVFGALTDRRVYKPPMEPEKALAIMSEEMTAELDQHLLVLFREMLLDAARSIDEKP